MTITLNITKVNVSMNQHNLYHITLNLSILNNEVEIWNKDFTETYRIGQVISDIINKFIISMQKEIDKYNAEQTILNHIQLDNAIINISNGLNL